LIVGFEHTHRVREVRNRDAVAVSLQGSYASQRAICEPGVAADASRIGAVRSSRLALDRHAHQFEIVSILDARSVASCIAIRRSTLVDIARGPLGAPRSAMRCSLIIG
jgi:hypothetical protein